MAQHQISCYDHAITAAGAKIVAVGIPNDTTPPGEEHVATVYDFESAITENAVAVAYAPRPGSNPLPEEIIALGNQIILKRKETAMPKEVIIIPNRPKAPYSPGIKAGGYIFVSGQVGLVDDKGRELKGIEAQARQCLENMKQVLEAAGSSLNDVVKVTVFLANTDDFAKMNEVYQSYLTEDLPARSTVISGLVKPAMEVEIDCIAYCP